MEYFKSINPTVLPLVRWFNIAMLKDNTKMFTALQMISSQFLIRDSFPFSHLEKFLGRLTTLWERGGIDLGLKSSFVDGGILAAC